MPTPSWLALLAAAALAIVHLTAGRLRRLSYVPRSAWLSFAGGTSVAYVFVHLLPELHAAQAELAAVATLELFAERHVWMVALAGLLASYAVDVFALRARGTGHAGDATDERPTPRGVYVAHIASFALYNGLIGYLLAHGERGSDRELLFYAIAMALHFVVNDASLRWHHRHRYDRSGRWWLAAAIVGGALLGVATRIDEALVAVLVAFLAGGVILNVLKEEVPRERQSRFCPFALGLAGHAALLLLV